METYKKASKLKLRFQTSVGNLSVEQLWELNLKQLSVLAKGVKETLTKSIDSELDFLNDNVLVDEEAQLRFDIVKDIYLSKKSEIDSAKEEKEKKEFNQKILALINEKQEGALRDKSIEEMTSLLK